MPFEHSTLRKLKMDLLHRATSEVMEPLNGCGTMSFEVSERGEKMGMHSSDCLILLRYCRGILYIGMRQIESYHRPCILCWRTMKGIQNQPCGGTRALSEMRKARRFGELRSRGSRYVRGP